MSELLLQLWSPEMQMMVTIIVVLLVALYVLSIVWVVRDAYMRGTSWYVWGAIALIPIFGLIVYCILRPPMMKIDRDEQTLEVELKKRQLMHYGECATCGYPVESDYVVCPNCHTQLKNLCPRCKKALEPMWTVCPYCATPVSGSSRQQRSGAPAAAKPRRSGAGQPSRSGASSQKRADASQAHRSEAAQKPRRTVPDEADGGATTAMPRSEQRTRKAPEEGARKRTS